MSITIINVDRYFNIAAFFTQGTGEYINTKFFCRVCSMLHEPRALSHPHSYADFNEWWRGKGTCINGSWRKYEQAKQNWAASSSSTTPKKVLPAPAKAAAEDSNKLDAQEVKEDS